MARINVDEEFWLDPRFEAMCDERPMHECAGAILVFWHKGQTHWRRNKNLIPLEWFKRIPLNDLLVKYGFAEVRENGVYCKGAEEKWNFLSTKRSEAGKKSAEARQKKYGTSIPKHATNYTEQTPNKSNVFGFVPNTAELTEPSSSSSSSSSKKENICAFSDAQESSPAREEYSQEFEQLWVKYPNKRDKQQAYKKFKATVVKPRLQADFQKALENYLAEIRARQTEPRFVKHLKTFLGGWQEYLTPEGMAVGGGDAADGMTSEEMRKKQEENVAKGMAAWDEAVRKITEEANAAQ